MLSWNEIRHRSIGFSREWRDTTSEKPFATDRQRVEYLFALYKQLTAPLAVEKKVRKVQTKNLPSKPDQNQASHD